MQFLEDESSDCGASLPAGLPAEMRGLVAFGLVHARPGNLKLPVSETSRLRADNLMVVSRYDIVGANADGQEMDVSNMPVDRATGLTSS